MHKIIALALIAASGVYCTAANAADILQGVECGKSAKSEFSQDSEKSWSFTGKGLSWIGTNLEEKDKCALTEKMDTNTSHVMKNKQGIVFENRPTEEQCKHMTARFTFRRHPTDQSSLVIVEKKLTEFELVNFYQHYCTAKIDWKSVFTPPGIPDLVLFELIVSGKNQIAVRNFEWDFERSNSQREISLTTGDCATLGLK